MTTLNSCYFAQAVFNPVFWYNNIFQMMV